MPLSPFLQHHQETLPSSDLPSNFLCASQWSRRLTLQKSNFLCHASLGMWRPIHSNYPLWTDGPKLQSKDQSLMIPRETVSWSTFSGSKWTLEKPWFCCISPLTAGRLRYQPHTALGLSRKAHVRNLEELLGGWLSLAKRTWWAKTTYLFLLWEDSSPSAEVW